MITAIPAEILNIKKGNLKDGYDADIVIFDENINVLSVIVGGDVKFYKS